GTVLDLRQLDDAELDAALLQRLRLPRTGDSERSPLLGERVLRLPVVDLRIDQTLTVPLVDQVGVLQEHPVRHAQPLRIQRAVRPRSEDVATEAREERIHVVRIPVAPLWDGDRDPVGALALERERFLLEL